MFDISGYWLRNTIVDYEKLKKKAILENFNKNNLFNKDSKINYELFMIYHDNKPIWFLGYKQKKSKKLDHNFMILNLYVDSKYQWQWVGSILYDYVEKEILKYKKNILRLYCKVTNTNTASINFFMKKWFKKIWEEDFSIHDKEKDKYYSSILFEKIIKN